MPGHFTDIDIQNVRNNAQNTIAFLQKKLSSRSSNRQFIIVFLGEEHANAIDTEVTRAILQNPPIYRANAQNLIIFERGLFDTYDNFYNKQIFSKRVEDNGHGVRRRARSATIANMIQDAFKQGIEVIYVACGNEHGKEIYDSLKTLTVHFTYLYKPSSTNN